MHTITNMWKMNQKQQYLGNICCRVLTYSSSVIKSKISSAVPAWMRTCERNKKIYKMTTFVHDLSNERLILIAKIYDFWKQVFQTKMMRGSSTSWAWSPKLLILFANYRKITFYTKNKWQFPIDYQFLYFRDEMHPKNRKTSK